jgi:peptide/nickel transport system substrate-binding protein
LPPKGHFNTFVTNAIRADGIYRDMLETPMAIYDWSNSECIPLLATEWKNEADGWYTVKLRSGIKWSDGSDFSSDDVLTTFQLARVSARRCGAISTRSSARQDHRSLPLR